MVINLPTPVSHPPSWRTCLSSPEVYPPQKYICKYKKLQNMMKSLFIINKKMRERV
jgi:hypothetical protein